MALKRTADQANGLAMSAPQHLTNVNQNVMVRQHPGMPGSVTTVGMVPTPQPAKKQKTPKKRKKKDPNEPHK